jgi:cyclophilin family peptidyl-prolyl cis-trans isomerase
VLAAALAALSVTGALAVSGALTSGAAVAADGDVVLEVAADANSVKLGEDIVLKLTVTNHTSQAIDVPVFRLADDAVSVRISWDGAQRAVITRRWGDWHEDLGRLAFEPRRSLTRRVKPGETIRGSIAFAAVVSGDITCDLALGADGPSRLRTKPVTVEVTPKSGAPKRLVAQVETSAGNFACELDGAVAFNAVSHFWRLAREGFYDGLVVHRVEPGILVQAGCPRGDGTGGPGWYLPAEGDARPLSRGGFGLARAAHPDSAGSQFVAVADKDGKAGEALGNNAPGKAEWTPLGRVIEGQDIVDAIAARETDPATRRLKAAVTVTGVKLFVR